MGAKTAEREPQTTLTVPAKPAAVSAANVLGLAAAGIATGGIAAVAVAGAAVAAPAVAYGARKVSRWRAGRQQQASRTLRTSMSRSGGVPKLPKLASPGAGRAGGRPAGSGRTGSGRPSGRSGKARSAADQLRASGPTSRMGRSGRSPLSVGRPTGRPAPGGSGSGRAGSRSPLGRLFGRSGSGQPGGRAGQSGARTSRLGRTLGKADRRLGAVGRGFGSTFGGTRGTKNPLRAARRASAAHRKAGGSNTGSLLAGLGSGALTAGKGIGWGLGWVLSWPFRHAWKRYKAHRPGPIEKRINQATKRQIKDSITRLREQDTTRGASPAPKQARPGQPIRLAGHTPTDTGGTTMGHTRELAGRMWTQAVVWQPRGMLDAVVEFDDLPETLGYFRATIGALMEKSQKILPVDPAIAQQLAQIVQTLDSAAGMAKKVPEALHTIHDAELARLDHRARAGESLWDRSANGLT